MPDSSLLAALGLPPRPAPGQAARAVALRVPVVLGGRTGAPRSPGETAAARDGATPAEAAALLAALLPGASVRDAGSGMPRVEASSGVTGPGIPVLAVPTPVDGPDGPYRSAPSGVERERGGVWERFDTGLPENGPGLLLFTPEARWVIAGGRAVVEDPFSTVTAALPRHRAEALLVRRLRFAPGILERTGPEAEAPAPPALEVARHAALLEGAPWDDPARLLGAREGVERVEGTGSRLVLELVTGDRAVFEIEATGGCWRARLVEGAFPAAAAWAERDGKRIRYGWRPAPDLDPLDPATRARLAFDLLSDLIRLAGT